MDIQKLITDVIDLCEDEAAISDPDTLRSVQWVLEQLASYTSSRHQAIDARLAGCVDDALQIEERAETAIQQLAIDAEAAFRDWTDVGGS